LLPSGMDYFFLVPKIVSMTKYLDVSRDEIERDLTGQNGQVEYQWEEVVEDDVHMEHFVPLRLNISCRPHLIVGWAISLKMHNIRIDGLDWHSSFYDPNGEKRHGWHRHEFDQKQQCADGRRLPTAALDHTTTQTQFLIRTLKEMKIQLSGVDHGNYELFPYSGVSNTSSE